MTDAEIKARVKARRWAEECLTAADDVAAFTQRVVELGQATGILPLPAKPTPIVPMTDIEKMAFENEIIFFGAHVAEPIRDIPLSYLCSLTDPPSPRMADFLGRVKRYLRHSQIKARIERGEL